MWTLARYGSKGGGKDNFFHPRGITVDEKGNVFVADSGNGRIVHLFNPRKEVQWRGGITAATAQGGALAGPHQVDMDRDGRLYVSDPPTGRVLIVNLGSADVLAITGGNGIGFTNGPTTIVCADGHAPYSYYKQERFFICVDRGGTRLWKFDFTGAVIDVIDLPKGMMAAYGATDYYHNIWLTDTRNCTVYKFDHLLRYMDTFGSKGSADNQFMEPRGIAIWKRFGQTFIAEKKGAQYYWVGVSCTDPKLSKTGGEKLKLTMVLSEPAYISLYTTHGADTTFLLNQRFTLNGRVMRLVQTTQPVAQGDTLYLTVEPTYSSYTYYRQDFPLVIR
jgi:hypothetical protein